MEDEAIRELVAEFGHGTVSIDHVETKRVMDSANYRTSGHRHEILYCGEWFDLCRTDLKDNVMTSSAAYDIDYYRRHAVYGARVVDRGGKRLFAVIDAFSDG